MHPAFLVGQELIHHFGDGPPLAGAGLPANMQVILLVEILSLRDHGVGAERMKLPFDLLAPLPRCVQERREVFSRLGTLRILSECLSRPGGIIPRVIYRPIFRGRCRFWFSWDCMQPRKKRKKPIFRH
jgi:hypothetical protein